MSSDPFGALTSIDLKEGPTSFYRLSRLEETGLGDLGRLPFSIRILLENALRHAGSRYVSEEHVQAVADWSPTNAGADVPFMPTRVVLQDFTGVPAVVDLAAMRDRLKAMDGDPNRNQPGGPGRPRHRPLGPGRLLRDPRGLSAERGEGVRTEPGAVRPPTVGPALFRGLSGWCPQERASCTR